MTPKIAEPAETIETTERIKPFSEMTPEELEAWNREFLAALEAGDDSAARESLAAGVPIYYAEEDTPEPAVIKEYPNGQRELVTFSSGSEEFLSRL
jgi:hypothetical protein